MTPQFIEILNNVKPEILENQGTDLFEADILDSLDVITLVTELETAYEIDLDPDDVIPENFSSADAIWALVLRYEKEKKYGQN